MCGIWKDRDDPEEWFRGIRGDLAARWLNQYRPSHGLDIIDAVIAATARVHGLELIALNLKHFPMIPGLKAPY